MCFQFLESQKKFGTLVARQNCRGELNVSPICQYFKEFKECLQSLRFQIDISSQQAYQYLQEN